MNTINKRFITKVFAILLSISLSCPHVFAGEVGKITYVEGRVDISRPNSELATPIREGETISAGDAIRTKSNSKAEVTFDDESVLRLAQNTKVEIKDYQLDKDSRRKTATINLDRGKARTIIAKMPDPADFIITTPNAEGRVKGSDIFAFYQAGNSGMLVSEGRLVVANIAHPEKEVTIPAGTSVLVPMDELPKGPRTYLELEKKLHEQDTSIPPTIARRKDAAVIKGVIVKMSGAVKIAPKGSAAAHDANLSEILGEGDRIETGANGAIEIKFDNGNGINLKPNTNILMGRLVFDPATGEYENLFESDRGAIRARIENLKGKSKFEVKTPLAVSGARGTIMYLSILSSLTQAFFDGGDGYISSLISNITKIIGAGENASADDNGNVSDPAHTTDSERESLEEGWDPGSGLEGYSSPEGTMGSYLYEDDTAPGAGSGNADTPETAGREPFSDLPITETETPPTTTPTQMTIVEEETLTFSGIWGQEDGGGSIYYNYLGTIGEAGEDFGVIGSTRPDWWNGEPFLYVAFGGYSVSTESPEPYIWNTPISSYNPQLNSPTTVDGGAFYGFTAGLWNDGEMEGTIAALYMAPTGTPGVYDAGYMRGDVTGAYFASSPAGGAWVTMDGTLLTSTPKAFGVAGVAPEDFVDDYVYPDPIEDNMGLYGSFGNDESYNIYGGQSFGHTYSIGEDARWGIFDIKLDDENYHEGKPDGEANWSAAMGGSDEGEYGIAYWLTNISGTWDDNEITADVTGNILSDHTLGAIEGDLFGVNDGDDGTWIATIIGSWTEEELTFSGFWGEDSLYYNRNGFLGGAGEELGMIGSATTNWWNEDSFSFLAMGEYDYRGGISESQPKIWNTKIYGYNAEEDKDTIQDGSAFYGFTAGIWNGGMMDGAIAGLYIAPGNDEGYGAGLLTGDDLSGSYYSGLDMWMATGTLEPYRIVEDIGISPDDLYEKVKSERLDGGLSGGFGVQGGSGDIEGRVARNDSNTYFIMDYDREHSQPWGIYDLKLEGPESYSNPDPDGSKIWAGEISGEGQFGYNYSQGVMRGRIFGLYDESGGPNGVSEGPNGEYGAPDEGYWIATSVGAWGGYYVEKGLTYDAGAYYGLVGGIWEDGGIIGGLAAIYIQPFDEDWDDGILMRGELSAGTLPPLSSGSFEGGSITLENFSGKIAGIINQPWGIWGAAMNGSYTGPTSPWKLALGGTVSGEDYPGSYWLGTVEGAEWAAGRLVGDFRGFLFAPTEEAAIEGGMVSGGAVGDYIDVDENGADTWEAVAAGEWVEVTELLDPAIFGPDGLQDLNDFVSVPITEVYSSVMAGNGAFDGGVGSITGSMDISLYSNTAPYDNGIWAAIVSGAYSGMTAEVNSWTLDVVNGSGTATFTGTQWSANQWAADVSGAVGGNSVTGQAAGTYTGGDSGTFTGVGAGTWSASE